MKRKFTIGEVPPIVVFWSFIGAFVLAISMLAISFKKTYDLQHKQDALIVNNQKINYKQKLTLIKQNRAINILCDRGYILENMIEAMTTLLQPSKNNGNISVFLETLQIERTELLSQLTDKESPCA